MNMEQRNEIYDPYVVRNGLYIPSRLEAVIEEKPVTVSLPRQQRRANERRMRKDIRKGLRRGMLKL